MTKRYSILVVDDEPANLQKLKRTFLGEFRVFEASSGESALEYLRKEQVAVIITDQRMPGMSGVEFLKRSLEIRPETIRVILTGFTEVEDLMDAINDGHVHRYITKPWDPYSLKAMIRRELERWELRQENERLTQELKKANELLSRENLELRYEVETLKERRSPLVYRSAAIEQLLKLLNRVVKTDSTVLVQGATGTGKELIARYIHEHSDRKRGRFVPVNCGAVPSELVESEFFGHRKGAFTGASRDRKGFFQLADRGTLFLDEIGEAPMDLQVKLLRVIQDNEIYPVGAERPQKVDVRIIASTNRNLSRMVEEGTFRQDLFFRLNVFAVYVPPLRARTEDIPVLAEYFCRKISEGLNKPFTGLHAETIELLKRYDWPGNVRELENEIERLVILSDGQFPIRPETLSERVRLGSSRPAGRGPLKEQLALLEKELILNALKIHGYNKTQAAESLGITRQTIIAKLKQYQSA